jgi:hypothetical protein
VALITDMILIPSCWNAVMETVRLFRGTTRWPAAVNYGFVVRACHVAHRSNESPARVSTKVASIAFTAAFHIARPSRSPLWPST